MSEAVLTRLRQPAVHVARPRPAYRPLLYLAGLIGLIHLISGVLETEYWVDEAYMLSAGRNHLALGYADQPPLVPLLAGLMDFLSAGSVVALRLPAIAATAATVVFVGLITFELRGDRRAQMLAAGAYATALWPALVGHWLTPYTIEPLQWTVLVWLLVRWIRLRDDRLLLLFGALVGIAMQTKFQIFLLCTVLAVCVLLWGPKGLLCRPKLWWGCGLALLIASPTLVWQAMHGWPQLGMGTVVASESSELGGRLTIAVTLISLVGFVGVPLLLYGLWQLLTNPRLRAYRFFGVAFLVLYVFFVATAGRPYYLVGLYGILLAAGAVSLQRRREFQPSRWGWTVWPAYAIAATVIFPAFWAADEPEIMPGITASETMVQRVVNTYQALPAATRSHTTIMGESYIVTAFLDNYAPKYGLPQAHSTHRGYGYFEPPPPQAHTVIYVGRDIDALRPYFAGIRQLNRGETPIWLCTGRLESWNEFWPRLRHL